MTNDSKKRPPDPFGDDEGVLDIRCRPALTDDLPQVAFLAAGLLNRIFGQTMGPAGWEIQEILQDALKTRLRFDCTWVMLEGNTVIGMIDLETVETRRLNGIPLPRALANELDLMEKIEGAGLLPLLVHEPAPDEVHQALVALLPGSRGEGRGTLLLMHGAFWARAQGKDWMTAWARKEDGFLPVYERRGYFVEKEVVTEGSDGSEKWVLLKRPISSPAHKILRMKEKEG